MALTRGINPFTAMISLENNQKSAKFEIAMPFFFFFFFLFFFTLACEQAFIKTHTVESRLVIGPKIRLFCRRIHANFRPEISQDAAVKGLKNKKEKEKKKKQ